MASRLAVHPTERGRMYNLTELPQSLSVEQLFTDAQSIEDWSRELSALEDEFETQYLRVYKLQPGGLDHQARTNLSILQIREEKPDLTQQIDGIRSNINAVMAKTRVLSVAFKAIEVQTQQQVALLTS